MKLSRRKFIRTGALFLPAMPTIVHGQITLQKKLPFFVRHGGDPNANLLVNLLADWWYNDAADGVSFGTIADHSGNGNTLSAKNTGCLGNVANAFGNFSAVCDSHTNSGDIQRGFCGTLAFSANQVLSMIAWVKLSSQTNSAPLLDNWGTNGFYLGQSGGGKWTFGVHKGDNSTAFIDENATATGSWFMLAGGWDGTNIWIQVNAGTRQTSAVADTHDITEKMAMDSYSVGAAACGAVNSIPTDGYIGRASIWTRSISTTEVTQLYNSGNGIGVAY